MLTNASQAQLEQIYQTIGGNPLAIKLMVGQISVLSLSQVLENLQQAQHKEIDEFYTYIYWQAWRLLDKVSQQVFVVMPLAQGGSLAQLEKLTQLETAALSQALRQLVKLSLVQVGGTLEDRRYTLHRLTETFLLNEVVKWQTLT